MAIIHILHIITIMSFISIISIISTYCVLEHECLCCTARNVSDVLPGIRDEDILLEYDAETPQLNIKAVSHAVDRLRYYYWLF
jgi:hypothetical protein